MRRRVNTRFLIGLVAVLLLAGIGLAVLYNTQLRRHAAMFLTQANQAEAGGKPEETAQSLGRYLDLVPTDHEAMARYGLLLDRQAQSASARAQAMLVLDEVLWHRPDLVEARRCRARLAVEAGQYAVAREHLSVLDTATPEPKELAELHARCEEGEGKHTQAAAWYKKALQYCPTDIDMYQRLALLLRKRLDRPEEADQVMDAMISANTASFAAYLARASYRKRLRALPEARQDIDTAYKLAPDEPRVLLARAELASAEGDWREARGQLERAIRIQPQRPEAYLALASLDERAGQRRQALACLRQALAAVPERAQAPLLFSLAELLISDGELKEGQTIIETLRQRNLPRSFLQYLQAMVLVQEKQWHAAVEALYEARSPLADQPELALKSDLMLAACFAALCDPEGQLQAYHRALSVEPLSVSARFGLASHLLATGKVEEALETLRYLMSQAQAPAKGWVLLGRALLLDNLRRPVGKRRWEETNEVLKRAAEAHPEFSEIALLQSQAFFAQGLADRSRQVLEQAQQRRPDEIALWIGLTDLADQMQTSSPALVATGAVARVTSFLPTEMLSLPAMFLIKGTITLDTPQLVLTRARRRLGDRLELRLAQLRYRAGTSAPEAPRFLESLEHDFDKLSAGEQDRLVIPVVQACIQLGDPSKAERLLGRLATVRPDNLALRLLLFDLASITQNDAVLKSVAADMKRIEGEQGAYWKLAEVTGLVARAGRGDRSGLDDARKRLAELARAKDQQARAHLLEGQIDELDGKPDSAIAHYKQVIALGDQRPGVYQSLIRLLYRQQRYAEALDAVQELQTFSRLSGEMARLAANVSLQANDPERALSMARQAVAEAPAAYADQVCLGLALWASHGKSQEAEHALGEAVRLADNLPGPWVALVHYLGGTGQKDKAETVLQAAAKKLPPGQAGLALGHGYETIGRPDKAEEHYRLALARGPRDTLLVLADFLARQQRIAEAFEICDQAWQHCAAERVADVCLGLLQKAPSEYWPRAESRLQAALEKSPASPRLLLGLAEVRFYQQRFADAAHIYQNVLELQPLNVVALNNLAWLLAFEEDKSKEALRHINRAIEILGPVGQLLETRAVVYLGAKRYALARKDLDDAMRQGATASQYFHLAQVQWESKEESEALESLRRAQSMNLGVRHLHPRERTALQNMLARLAAD